MSWPLPSVAAVRVSLHVTTTQETHAGASALWSRVARDAWDSGFSTLLPPYGIRLQPLDRSAFADMLIEDRRYISLLDLSVPGCVGIDHDGRPVFARPQAS